MAHNLKRLLPLVLVPLLLAPSLGLAQSNDVVLDDPQIYEKSLRALTILLVLAVVVENALAVIFNWRVFLAYFSLRGVRTVIMVAVSYALVETFDKDVLGSLLEAYDRGGDDRSNMLTTFLTALIIAGGSSGVHNLMYALGYRDSRREQEVNPTPPQDKAWVAVKVRRVDATGPVHVEITEADTPPRHPAIAGTCLAARPGLLSLLTLNRDRYPANGGHELIPNRGYQVSVSGTGQDGTMVRKAVSHGPVVLAPGAIVDFQITL